MTQKERIYLYDSTLRDGAQTSTVNFNSKVKADIAKMLDGLAVDYIEGGWPGANPVDDEFFANLPDLKNSQFTAFGMTRRANTSAQNDPGLNALINSAVKSICIVGKAWDFHLTNALNISEEENLAMIGQSIAHIKNSGKEPMFDAEHFFDGYKANPGFALKVIRTAFENGARWVVLCDTNGGTLPFEIFDIISEVTKSIPGENIGIHCHNDTGNAVANSIAAVRAGARQIQGTINGLGERCGNANLTTLIPILTLKMGYKIGAKSDELKNLVKAANFLDETLGKDKDLFAPFVGEFAFAHKGGLHVSAIAKNPKSYEHIEPELVGNRRKIMISNQAGRSNIINRLKEIGLDDAANDANSEIKYSQISDLVNQVKELEAKGYAYDAADASFELLAKRALSVVPTYFNLISFRVLDERKSDLQNVFNLASEATIKIEIDGKEAMAVAEGNGPVNALDNALRNALSKKYPILQNVFLSDYKVRILTPSDGTEAITRVKIESSDNKGNKWQTIGVSSNIVDASYRALYDSITFKLMKEGQ
jgi:2-isopropylmalate synthase